MAVRIYDAEVDSVNQISLWPEQRSWEWLMSKKRVMPTALYNAQYRNNPRGLKGVRYDIGWLQFYSDASRPPLRELVGMQAGDPATSERSTSNYFGHCTGAKHPETGIIYILDFDFGHIPAPSHLEFLRGHYTAWTLRGLVIQKVILEEQGPGQATTQNLVAQTRMDEIGAMPIVTVKPVGSKEQRFDAMLPFISNGTVLFKGQPSLDNEMTIASTPGFQEFLLEYSSFPRGGRDDVLDALWIVINELTSSGLAAAVSEDDQDKLSEPGEIPDPVASHLSAEKQRRLEEYDDWQKDLKGGRLTARDRVLGGKGIFH